MEIKRIHPYAESADPEVAREFYVGVFGLDVAMEEPVLDLVSRQVPSAQLIVPGEVLYLPAGILGNFRAEEATDLIYVASSPYGAVDRDIKARLLSDAGQDGQRMGTS